MRELPNDPLEALRVIEWADREIERTRPANPAGFMIHLIQEKVTPPSNFLSSEQLHILEEEAEANRLRDDEHARLYAEYEEYTSREVDNHISALAPSEYRGESRPRSKS